MLAKNMRTFVNSLDPLYKTQLDQFVENNYTRFLRYAKKILKNTGNPEELVQSTVVLLYEGRRSPIQFGDRKNPLKYVYQVMQSVSHHQRVNRQKVFDSGSRVKRILKVKNGKQYEVFIWEPIRVSEEKASHVSDEVLDDLGGYLREALDCLTPRYREVIEWKLEGIPLTQMALQLPNTKYGKPSKSMVQGRINRGLTQIKRYLHKKYGRNIIHELLMD